MYTQDPNRHKWIAFLFALAMIPMSIFFFLDSYKAINLECKVNGDCIYTISGLIDSTTKKFKQPDIRKIEARNLGKQGICLSVEMRNTRNGYTICANKHTEEQLREIAEKYSQTGNITFFENQKDWCKFLWFVLTVLGFGMALEGFRDRNTEAQRI